MQNLVKQQFVRSVFFLLLLLSTGIVFGQKSGQEKTLSRIDTIGVPKRITYLQESGVFLNEKQERITLEKLLWKEQYRQDAVSMYWINKALEERINETIEMNKILKEDLSKCETTSISAIGNMEHYRKLFKDSEAETNKYRNENSQLKGNLRLYKFLVLGTSAVIIIHTVNNIR